MAPAGGGELAERPGSDSGDGRSTDGKHAVRRKKRKKNEQSSKRLPGRECCAEQEGSEQECECEGAYGGSGEQGRGRGVLRRTRRGPLLV